MGVAQQLPDALWLDVLRQRADELAPRYTKEYSSPQTWRVLAALALAELGRSDEAVRLAAEELESARDWGGARTLGRALRVAGLIDPGPDRLTLMHEAVAVLETSPAQLELAHALGSLGAALRRAGKRVDARDAMRHAIDRAHSCGARALEQRLRDELVAAGGRPRRVMVSGVDSLTSSELRVARLAAAGKSNREIAQELFVTLKTVEMHLANAFRKLEISSRTQLAGLLEPAETAG